MKHFFKAATFGLYLLLALLSSCVKDAQQPAMEELLSGLTADQLKTVQSLGIRWDASTSRTFGTLKITELPLERNDHYFRFPKPSQTTASNTASTQMTEAQQAAVKRQNMSLFILEKPGEPIEYRKVYYLPDEEIISYAQKPGLFPENTDYTGDMLVTTLEGKSPQRTYFKNGRVESPDRNATTAVERADECGWMWLEVEWTVVNITVEGGLITSITSTPWRGHFFVYIACGTVDDLIAPFTGPTGGGGGTITIPNGPNDPVLYPPPAELNFTLEFPTAPDVSDVTNDLICLRPDLLASVSTDTYKVGIYVEQPIPGVAVGFAYDLQSTRFKFGQSYLYLEKKEGSNPTEKAVLLFQPDVQILGNFAPYKLESVGKVTAVKTTFPYHIGFEQEVSALTFSKIINRVNGYKATIPSTQQYNVNTSNSTDFVLYVTDVLQLNLRPAQSVFPNNFLTNNPGILGQTIRQLSASTSLSIKESSTAPFPSTAATCL